MGADLRELNGQAAPPGDASPGFRRDDIMPPPLPAATRGVGLVFVLHDRAEGGRFGDRQPGHPHRLEVSPNIRDRVFYRVVLGFHDVGDRDQLPVLGLHMVLQA